ncbi:hypothetical protein C1I95_20695 [Micromonospora craterilacus]|uniref:Uncharacterized protein n=1 Tax=Micromonospora craterilacus TaxID=1655439 RepID=A0A2W2F019_9ACTN|nr:hypothetical protein C1I95_20695 [Micromonospora craterilacus]
MNQLVRVRVSGSDQDRSTVVTRVAVPVGRAVLPWTGTDGDPSIRRPHEVPAGDQPGRVLTANMDRALS